MSRLELDEPSKADLAIEQLYKDLERRIEASPSGLCPVDITRAFLELCRTASCGKCVPCRIGIWQLKNLHTDIMNLSATPETLELIEELAKTVRESADCAIGYEAGQQVLSALRGCRDDYEAHVREKRCLCRPEAPVPCVELCPAHVDVPGYVALVGEGRYADAVRLIRKDNPFPSACAFICEHPCEAHCRRNIIDNPINIRALKRAAVDCAGAVAPPPCAASTGKRIAIVGGGPGGLSAAYYLQLMGHQTTLFEMHSQLGGMLRYGIPNYRLPRERLDEDIEAVMKTGVEVVYGKRVGEELSVQSLRAEYDAVLIAIGASVDKKLGIEGEGAEGVISAVKLLQAVEENRAPEFHGREVCVIGGGNVSMDAARTALRLGAARVSIVYRRREADMTALPSEIKGAEAEGAELRTLLAPERVETDGEGRVSGIWLAPQMVSRIRDGRAGVRPAGGESVFLPCRILIVAIGQDIESQHFRNAGIPVEHGKLKSGRFGGFENIPGIFAGGDCASGPSSVIEAVAAGKVIAANIDEYLGYRHVIGCEVEIPEAEIADRSPCGRAELSEREAGMRVHDFEGVEKGLSRAEARQEAARCLRCDHYGYGSFQGGRPQIW